MISAPHDMDETRDPLVGMRIDNRYLVTGVLGRGGMGVVYAGVHEQLGREVAVKVLGPGIANDPTAVARFLREARTASQLTHGNIVDVSDLGTLPDGRPYLVMAKLHGIDLCTLLQRRGPQTPRRTAQLLHGAAAALDLIHAKGYVHRDVKPENLMHVVREDGSEAVLLLDFGIVGLLSPDSARLTAAGVLFGTPAYLAPEVIRGGVPTASSDLYALATVAFEMMTGHLPFGSPNPFQLMQAKVSGAAPRMQDIAGFELPEAIERVIATALEREQERRYGSAGAFIGALEAAVHAHASVALPITANDGLDSFARERLQSETGKLELNMDGSLPPASILPPAGRSLPPSAASLYPTAAYVVQKVPTYRRQHLALAAGLLVCVALVWLAVRKVADWNSPHKAPTITALPVRERPPPTAAPVVAAPAAALTVAPPAPPTPTPIATRPAPRKASPTPDTTPTTTTMMHGPTSAELVQQAQTELVQGHLAASAAFYLRATQADPRNASAFRGLGLVSERLGHTQDAIRALRRAQALSPGDSSNALLEERIRKLEQPR
ncbi:MAG: hypothetical protein RL701_99 [Pseudomonadota bacterium]